MSNDTLKKPEAKDRFVCVPIGNDNKRFKIREEAGAGDMLKNDKVHAYLKKMFMESSKEMQADMGMYFLYNHVRAAPIRFNLVTASIIANFCLNKVSERCPFFVDSNRKYKDVIGIAILFCAYKNKILLTNTRMGKYYKKKFIHDISGFCSDMSKRMVVGYKEIIPALFCMIDQYIDANIINVLRVFKEKLFKIKGDLTDKRYMKRYFKSNICSEENLRSGKIIDFMVSNADDVTRGTRSGGSANSNNNTGGGGGRNYEDANSSNPPEVFLDPNFIEFKTEMNKKIFATEIQKHLKLKISVENIESILTELREKRDITIKKEELYQPVRRTGYLFNDDIYRSPGHFSRNLVQGKAKHDVSKKMLFFKHVKSRSGGEDSKSVYRFPIGLFSFIESFKSGVEILKDVVVKELPFKDQTKSKFVERQEIVVSAVDLTSDVKISKLVIKPHDESPQKFILDNPKKLPKTSKSFYELLKEHHRTDIEKHQLKTSEFFTDMMKKDTLAIDHSLEEFGFEVQQENFNLADDEIKRLIQEESEFMANEVRENSRVRFKELVRKFKREKRKEQEELDKMNLVEDDEDEDEDEDEDAVMEEVVIVTEEEDDEDVDDDMGILLDDPIQSTTQNKRGAKTDMEINQDYNTPCYKYVT
jgi:hypothetical protein